MVLYNLLYYLIFVTKKFMKRIYFLPLLLIWNFSNAQLIDVGANTQLGLINESLATLNLLIKEQNTTTNNNKIENYKQRLLGKENFDFIKKVEDYMWKADEYLKKGREIQMIYNKEEDILKKLQSIKRNTSKYAKFETSASYISEINKSINATLNQVGTLVDDAHIILGDKNTRMSTEGRREILKETLSKLIIIERSLDNIILQGEITSIKEQHYQKQEEYQQDVKNSMEQIRKYNNKK